MSVAPEVEKVELTLSSELLRRIRAEAERRGTDAEAILVAAVTEKAARIEEQPHAGMSLREILAPVHEETRQMGWTDDEVGEFVDAEVAAYRCEKYRK